MVALSSSEMKKDWSAPVFRLQGTDGKFYTLDDVKEKNGLVVAFICNHCPYVKAIVKKIKRDADELKEKAVGFVAINPNDSSIAPDDSFEKMQEFAKKHEFEFPYLVDLSQEVAKSYDAVCTPDFFGFNSDLKLQYRGRLDSSKVSDTSDSGIRELFPAMCEIIETNTFTGDQHPSIGCSIKWKRK